MKQQSGNEHARYDLRPVDFPVERVQLAAEVKRPENEGSQAENVKVYGPRGIPTARKNEESNEEIQQADNAKIIFRGKRLFCWRGNQWRLELLAVARQPVAHLGPQARAVQPPCDVGGP